MEIIIRKQELNLGYNASSKEFAETIAKDYTFGAIKPVAMVGVNGINPNNSGYKIPSLESREFGGYEFLAWYYVSWARAIPEKLSALGLPFAEAYEAALLLYNKKS